MKPCLRALLSLLAAFTLAGGLGSALAADTSADMKAAHAVNAAFVVAYNAGDLDTVLAQYADNAQLLPPGAPMAEGKAAIRAFFAVDVAGASKEGLKFVLNPNPQGGVSGDLAWTSGTFSVKDKNATIVEKGKYLAVLRKVGGKWLYLSDTWNADAEAAPAPAAPPKK